MFSRWESLAFNGLHISRHCLLHATRALHEVTHEARRFLAVDAQHVVQHQYLAVALGTGAYAYGRNGNAFGNLSGQGSGNQLEYQQTSASVSKGTGICHQLARLLHGLALYAVTTELVYGLG